jgi:hypothetical protein
VSVAILAQGDFLLFFDGILVFLFLPDSAVLVLTFTAWSLLPLVYLVHQAIVIHVPTLVGFVPLVLG